MSRLRRRPRGNRPIVTRLVLSVAAAMTVVLLLTSGFVFWRVQFALSRQVDQDLDAYREQVERAVEAGDSPVRDTPGEHFQIYTTRGRLLDGNASHRLTDHDSISKAARGETQRDDVGSLVPASKHPARVITARTRTPHGDVVVAYAISLADHDEALRELLLQLAIADALVLAAAAAVGYWTARSALDPVERYRRAAASAALDTVAALPVPEGDDELTRLGHTLNDLLGRIAKSNARERQFLGDASHELRSPLTVMRSELEWALSRPRSGGELRESLESLQSQVLRLIELCNALLELQELRGADEPDDEPVELTGICADAVERITPDADELGRRIRLVAPSLVDVPGRSRWLDLAVGNLLTNSLRHGAGLVTVTVTGEPAHAVITVSDEGPGFPPDFIPTAFDRFTRADESRSTRGTGLGLALVRAVAEAHHGTASIDGAAVTLRLPR